ncbi:MAG: hypothetical protein OES79_07290, partial [Planctomycetota bacterium]|nr:hypothetical protein [Planctomycetota bacterium]
ALLALSAIARQQASTTKIIPTKSVEAAEAGVRWLLQLQNRDGGWPTFCRGWGKLPFDRSGTDLTAHAIRALHAWLVNFDQVREYSPLDRELRAVDILQAIQRGFEYLDRQQRPDGSWIPLWFGNQDHAEELNPVYGTSRVLLAYGDLRRLDHPAARRAVDWLRAAQGPAGDWGSVEETSLALEALLADPRLDSDTSLQKVIIKGLQWLVEAIQQDRHRQPAPIGFYFARLWYYESLYPLVFATSALGQAVRRFAPPERFAHPDLQGQQLVSVSNA